MAQNTGPSIAQFTAGSTERLTHLQLGFIPDFALVIGPHTATNPSMRWWFNKANLSQWAADDQHLLTTGSSGNITQVSSGIRGYEGGDVLTEDETINSNPVHPFSDGRFAKAGGTTLAGLTIPAASLVANGKYIVVAWRRTEDSQVYGFAQ